MIDLAKLAANRERIRAQHPDIVAWLEAWKGVFPGGEGRFYRRAPEHVGPTMDRMLQAARWDSFWKRRNVNGI